MGDGFEEDERRTGGKGGGGMSMRSANFKSSVLIVGQSVPVLETVTDELTDLGFNVTGTTDPSRASCDFLALDYDLIAFGGGIPGDLRMQLKNDFKNQHPAARFLDVVAPTAVVEIAATLEGDPLDPMPDLEAYFDRIGYRGQRTVTLETLVSIHRHHIDAIPFEAIDVFTGKGVDVSPSAVTRKLIEGKRGGYCVEQNPLLQRVLQKLGFQVEGLSGRVNWMAHPGSPPAPRSHAALKVTLDGQPWLVDAGFGSAVLPSPIKMDTAHPQTTSHEPYRIFPFGQGLRLQTWREGKWLNLYDLFHDPQSPADYEMINWYTSQHADSPFRKSLMVARTTPDKRYALRNGRFTIRTNDGRKQHSNLDAKGIALVLEGVFGLVMEEGWWPVLEDVARIDRTA